MRLPARLTPPMLRPIAWHSNHLGGETYLAPAGKETMSSKVQHRMMVGGRATGVRLLYSNPDVLGGGMTLTVKAHINLNAKTYPVTFNNGATSVAVPPRAFVLSDPVPMLFDHYETPYFYTMTYVSVPTGGRLPVGVVTTASNAEGTNINATASGGPDLTLATWEGTPPSITTGTFSAYSPAAIVGIPENDAMPSVCLFGDSIAVGAGDSGSGWATGGTAADYGFVARALSTAAGPTIPLIYSARHGETGVNAGFNGKRFRSPILDYATDMIYEYGTNDIAGTDTADTIKLYMTMIWALGRAKNKRVWACTIVPRTTSTDAWATVGNQTVQANESKRVDVNGWLRAGAPISPTTFQPVAVGTGGALVAGDAAHYLTGLFEVADTVESARDSGKWKAGYTADGIHPNPTGHAAAAAAINTSLFAV